MIAWRPEFAAGVLACTSNGRCLFVRRSDNGLWSVPGGHIESGENSAQAAEREFEEETGRHVRVGQSLGVIDGFRVFAARVRDEFRPELNGEHTAYKWTRPCNAPKPLYPGLGALLCS